jgi:hypothetical protein
MTRLIALALASGIVGLGGACGGPQATGDAASPSSSLPADASAPLSVPPMVAANPDCGVDDAYIAAPAWSGKKPSLPPLPEFGNTAFKYGEVFTVAGAIHALRSRFESAELEKRDITIVGIIVDTNAARAPRCAVHRIGIADPKGCTTEVPTFTIGDEHAPPSAPRIRVAGWASSFANVYEAQIVNGAAGGARLHSDAAWAVEVPWPLPAVGAKVRVTGRYGTAFTKSTSGVLRDPNGILTFVKLETVVPPPKPFAF